MDKQLDQQLDQKLRESYQQHTAKAPEGFWEQLQMHLPEGTSDLDAQLDAQVHASYKGQKAVAPAGLWASLESQLPATDTGLDQQLDEKLKEGFAQQVSKIAPLSLWDAISEKLHPVEGLADIDAQLDEKVKESFEEVPSPTPHKVWAAVNRQLNIDQTWQRISSALDVPVVRFDWKLRGLQLFIVLLLLLLWVRSCEVIPPKPEWSEPMAVTTAQQPKEKNKKALLSPILHKNNNKQLLLEPSATELLGAEETAIIVPAWSPVLEEGKMKKGQTAPNYLTDVTIPDLNIDSIMKAVDDRTTFPVYHYDTAPSTVLAEEAKENTTAIPFLPTRNTLQVPLEEQNNSNNTVVASQPAVPNNGTEQGKSPENTPTASTTALEQQEQPTDAASALAQTYLAAKFLDGLTLPPLVLPSELELVQAPKWKNKYWTLKNKLAVGVFITVNSTVLLNNETREGFDYNSLTTNYFGLAANYGLWARYRLHKKGALVAEYSINADHRQAYGTFQKGQYFIKEYVFKYNRASLAYQMDVWQNHKGLGIDNKVTAQLGAYVGSMRAARVYYDQVLVNDKAGEYHHFDAGLKIALGHEVTIDQFVIGYGIRSDVGLANIFKGNRVLSGQENRTSLIHLGGYLHLGYQF